MNLIDGLRHESGLIFGSSIYAKDHVSTSINSKLLPEYRASNDIALSYINQVKPTASVFANTVKGFQTELFAGHYELIWSVNNFNMLSASGLIPSDYKNEMFNDDFFEFLDIFLSNCLKLNNGNKETLNRLVAILMSTNYLSLDLACEYNLDDSLTEDMVYLLGKTVESNKIFFTSLEECQYVLEAVKLPQVYSEALLEMR